MLSFSDTMPTEREKKNIGNSRPYFVWTVDGISKIDLAKARRLKKYRTGESTIGNGIYRV